MPDSEPDTPGELAGDDKRIAHLLLVNDDGVREVFSRPRFWAYLAQVIERWKFTVFDAKARAFQTDRDLILGSIWLVLSPILDGLMYGFIFGVILRTSRGIENFIGYVMIGITFFNMMNGAMQMGCGLVRTFKGMLGSFDMPAASGVISRNLRLGFDSIIPAIVAVIIGLITSKNGISPWIITLIPLYILINMFGLGLMFVSARLTAQIPDLKAQIGRAHV